MKRAEVVSVGTELLMGQIVDTNAAWLAAELPSLGLTCTHRQTVGDNLERLDSALRLALSRADVVFTIGGLGPTQDDLTREGIAQAFSVEQTLDPAIEQHLRDVFVRRNLVWRDSQLRQASYPVGARPIDNPNGTAPGLWMESGGKLVVALPGPPGEFRPMVDSLRERLRAWSGQGLLLSRILKVYGMGESTVEGLVSDLVESENPTLAPYAKLGEVHLRITISCGSPEEGTRVLDASEAEIRERLQGAVYGRDSETLESVALDRLRERKQTLSTAESVTGGMLASRFVGVAGASQVFRGGVVAYSIDAKVSQLGVSRHLIELHSPVSREVCAAMAAQTRKRLGVDWAVATVGNAGPTSDVGGAAVGLCYVAVEGPNLSAVTEHTFLGQREDVRIRTTQVALTLLLKSLTGE